MIGVEVILVQRVAGEAVLVVAAEHEQTRVVHHGAVTEASEGSFAMRRHELPATLAELIAVHVGVVAIALATVDPHLVAIGHRDM